MSAPISINPSSGAAPRSEAKREQTTRDLLATKVSADIVQSQRKLAELRAAEQAEEAKLRQSCEVAILYGFPLITSVNDAESQPGSVAADGPSTRGTT